MLQTLLSHERVSTLSLKTLQKGEKCYFQALRTFAFDPKVASKKIYKNLQMKKILFKKFLTLQLAFPKNGFDIVTQNFAKAWKMLFPNAQDVRFWPQGSFKRNL